MSASHIHLERICKRYRERQVLKEIDITIRAGELIAFVGRSGSGKSTLLRIIGALERPDSGTLTYRTKNIAALDENARSMFRRKSVGFVFQSFNLINTLSVAENIALPLQLNLFNQADIRRRVTELLEQLNIAQYADQFPDELSGGEQQRVAIARALAHKPQIVIADEPTGNLDLETARTVLSVLGSVCREQGASLLVATHSDEVTGMADRVVRIVDSRLQTL